MQIVHVYIKCVHCGQWHDHANIVSYTSFSGRGENWSDGKTVTSYDHEFASFVKCGNCGEIFWENDAMCVEEHYVSKYVKTKEKDEGVEKNFTPKQLAAIEDFIKGGEMHDLPDTSYPLSEYFYNDFPEVFIIEDLDKALRQGEDISMHKEIELRVYLWHTINDFARFRKMFELKRLFELQYLKEMFDRKSMKNQIEYRRLSEKKFTDYQKLRVSNLERLVEILNPVKNLKANIIQFDSSDIQKIEINRELGRFDKAKEQINKLNEADKKFYRKFIYKSSKYISNRDTRIFRID